MRERIQSRRSRKARRVSDPQSRGTGNSQLALKLTGCAPRDTGTRDIGAKSLVVRDLLAAEGQVWPPGAGRRGLVQRASDGRAGRLVQVGFELIDQSTGFLCFAAVSLPRKQHARRRRRSKIRVD